MTAKANYLNALSGQTAPLPSYAVGGMGTGVLEETINDPRFKVQLKIPYKEEIVTRSTVWDYYRTSLLLPNPSDVLAKLNANIEEVDQLICDGRVKTALNNRRAGVLSMTWSIDQNSSPIRVYKTIKKVFQMLPVYDIMSEMLMAPIYGYNISEVIWNPSDGLILPKNIQGKAQRWFGYSDKNEIRFKTKMNQVQGEKLPPRKFLVTRYHPRYDDPYAGREALFNALYWPVKFRHMIMEYGIQFVERYGSPWLDVQLEAGLQQERLTELLNVLQTTYQNGIVAHPDNTKITALQIGDHKNVQIYSDWLDVMNREIDMAILGQNLSTEVKGGSYAAANAHMVVRQDIINEDVRMVEATMDQLIEWIGWYNFPASIELPKFKLKKLDPPTKEMAEIDYLMWQQGVRFKKAYYQRSYGLTEEEFDIVESMSPDVANGIADADASRIRDEGIEAKDQASNIETEKAINRGQEKGLMFAEDKDNKTT